MLAPWRLIAFVALARTTVQKLARCRAVAEAHAVRFAPIVRGTIAPLTRPTGCDLVAVLSFAPRVAIALTWHAVAALLPRSLIAFTITLSSARGLFALTRHASCVATAIARFTAAWASLARCLTAFARLVARFTIAIARLATASQLW